jgi:hypothetical protein
MFPNFCISFNTSRVSSYMLLCDSCSQFKVLQFLASNRTFRFVGAANAPFSRFQSFSGFTSLICEFVSLSKVPVNAGIDAEQCISALDLPQMF